MGHVAVRTRWAQEDRDQLAELVRTMSSRKAAEVMGRSHQSVRKAMDRFKIRGVPQHLWHTTLTPEEQEARRTKIRNANPSKYGTQELGKKLRQRARLHVLYNQIFEILGGVCARCAEDNPLYLEIDHVSDDGAEHRRMTASGIPYYQELLRVAIEEPGRLQLLCANHHVAKRRLQAGW